MAAPTWAARSIPDDDGITHELVSRRRPVVRLWRSGGSVLTATEVSVSATDRLVDDTWIRARPTIQVEGGSYPLEAVLELRRAIDDLLDQVDGA
jgi:hypothetical protein